MWPVEGVKMAPREPNLPLHIADAFSAISKQFVCVVYSTQSLHIFTSNEFDFYIVSWFAMLNKVQKVKLDVK